jgi:hypothetical protein
MKPSIWLIALMATLTTMIAITPSGLRCENRTEPRGIDVAKPRFAWMLDAGVLAPDEAGIKRYTNAITRLRSETLKSDGSMPYTMKVSCATLRQPDGNTTFFQTAIGLKPCYFHHSRTQDDPLKTEHPPYSFDYQVHNETWPSGCWLPNTSQEAGGCLSIYVPRKSLSDYNVETLCRIQCTIEP